MGVNTSYKYIWNFGKNITGNLHNNFYKNFSQMLKISSKCCLNLNEPTINPTSK